jgi:hypothetical protein
MASRRVNATRSNPGDAIITLPARPSPLQTRVCILCGKFSGR